MIKFFKDDIFTRQKIGSKLSIPKFLTNIFSLTLIFSLLLTSCSTEVLNDYTINNPLENISDMVTINIVHCKSEIENDLLQAIDTYMLENSNVKITLKTLPSKDYQNQLRSNLTDDITIFNIGGAQDVLELKYNLQDLSEEEWVNFAINGTLDSVTIDDNIYGMPVAIEGYGLIYNKNIFNFCGIDASTIDTYVELEKAFKKIESKINSGELSNEFPYLEAVTDFSAKDTWTVGLYSSNAFLNQEFSSALTAAKSNELEFIYSDAFKKYIDLMGNYSRHMNNKSLLNNVDNSTTITNLAFEKVAVIQQGDWLYNDIYNLKESTAENLGILPIPVQGVVENSVPIGVSMYWAINKDASKNEKESAKDFLNWLYQSDEGKNIVVNNFLFLPPFNNYGSVEPFDSLGQSLKSYYDQNKFTSFVYMGYPTNWGTDVLGVNIQNYFNGTMTWEEVIEQSKLEWETMR